MRQTTCVGALGEHRYAQRLAAVATPLPMALDVSPRPARPSQRLQVKLTVTNPTGSTVTGGVVQLRYPARLFSLSESLVTGPLDVLQQGITDLMVEVGGEVRAHGVNDRGTAYLTDFGLARMTEASVKLNLIIDSFAASATSR